MNISVGADSNKGFNQVKSRVLLFIFSMSLNEKIYAFKLNEYL